MPVAAPTAAAAAPAPAPPAAIGLLLGTNRATMDEGAGVACRLPRGACGLRGSGGKGGLQVSTFVLNYFEYLRSAPLAVLVTSSRVFEVRMATVGRWPRSFANHAVDRALPPLHLSSTPRRTWPRRGDLAFPTLGDQAAAAPRRRTSHAAADLGTCKRPDAAAAALPPLSAPKNSMAFLPPIPCFAIATAAGARRLVARGGRGRAAATAAAAARPPPARLRPSRRDAAAGVAALSAGVAGEECFDVLDADGRPTGVVKPRSRVHADGDWHHADGDAAAAAAAAAAATDGAATPIDVDGRVELLLQLRAADKDTYPGRWDVSAAGHIAAGDASADTAGRELAEELGLSLPAARIGGRRFVVRSDSRGSTAAHGAFVDREHQDVGGGWAVQAAEVDGVAWFGARELRARLASGDAALVPRPPEYIEQLWEALRRMPPGP
ncbi:LOW QUALITY PROTEIN: hypothetical protein BU14_0218s0021 [Porphyra umbilicalis]|uniref:Nudix hydrolase domain-containing protein n=1 Tax=Porphyra umbilicalis TaxID=2786 RepID=A0A1X6P522_PORUM|nr:LOW QUALITY PROTEIN: hypothetical protein BU14_0218s0021 [Porphyra umbilicalis]|eukprot:OSX75855.1 LOW QUALITY PROTEIN: hypothetical protein BU14_0218s0021 [Porphyra umbilicalis]